MARLIHGFFFQNREWLSVAHRSEVEGGVGVVIHEGLCRYMYSGVIYPNPHSEQELIGEMFDHFGESELFDVKITQEDAEFAKKYDNRNDIIRYKFRRVGDLWVGEYSSPATGRGGAKCTITEAPDSLFLPPD
ncbi:MAG: hypothetical protein PHS79_01765 [Patescibacteria group bacterium]|nr:hypothetical protein [Patescibacteria group bacterium]